MRPKDKKGFFLLLPGGKYEPAARRACPSLWFWNVGEPPSWRVVAGLEAASSSPQTRPANPLCVCPGNQANSLHATFMGAEAAEPMPRPSQGCPWAETRRPCGWRCWKDGDSLGNYGFKEIATFWRRGTGQSPLSRGQEGTQPGGTFEGGVSVDMPQTLRKPWLLFLGPDLPISKERGPCR